MTENLSYNIIIKERSGVLTWLTILKTLKMK